MFDRILKFGANFDWISPLIAIGQDIINGPSYTFLIPANCGWTGREIISLLRRNGIKTWGHMIVNDTLMISVRQTQAQWATFVLERAGIPLGDESPGQSRDQRASGKTDKGQEDTLEGELKRALNQNLW